MSIQFISFLLCAVSFLAPSLRQEGVYPYNSSGSIRSDIVFPSMEKQTIPLKKDILSLGPEISAKSAIVVDSSSGVVLFSKNENEKRSLASITKLISALVFLDKDQDLSLVVEMTEEDNREGGDSFIKPGESASLKDYLVASLLGSANNATMVLSRVSEPYEQEFVDLMNKKARQIGMNNTFFVEPTGLSPQNISTAKDITRLLREISKNKTISEITGRTSSSIKVYPSGETRYIFTTNHLAGTIVPVEFGKTGYIDQSLYNLATAVKTSSGKIIYIVTFGSESNEKRVQDAKSLAIWTQRTYSWGPK